MRYYILAGEKEFTADVVCDGCLSLLYDHEMQLQWVLLPKY